MLQRLQKAVPLLVFIGAFILIRSWPRIELLFNPIDGSALAAQDVVMYSTSWCSYCAQARSFLNQADIPFTEYDIEKSPEAYREYQRLSGRGVPVFRIGRIVIQGYDPKLIRRAIEQLNQSRSS